MTFSKGMNSSILNSGLINDLHSKLGNFWNHRVSRTFFENENLNLSIERSLMHQTGFGIKGSNNQLLGQIKLFEKAHCSKIPAILKVSFSHVENTIFCDYLVFNKNLFHQLYALNGGKNYFPSAKFGRHMVHLT
ncbi:hypothetical protein RF11_00918 [Thelohanellus kitauei]|uniref:Uncharacterized protein n=1 Tax=Thelohanellus kitauei TaxID=669202 RepID=A0A0C2MV89_THEKT|nr:hypothetical protein RF11_00918 [Thelohanellus kitauei]